MTENRLLFFSMWGRGEKVTPDNFSGMFWECWYSLYLDCGGSSTAMWVSIAYIKNGELTFSKRKVNKKV